MRNREPPRGECVRLSILVYALEHPDLYRELQRLPKGAKRTHRLLTLANERILLARTGPANAPVSGTPGVDTAAHVVESEASDIAAGLAFMGGQRV